MAIETITFNTTNEFLTLDAQLKNDKKKNNSLIQKAKELGIDVEQFYIYNENKECIGIDTVKLNAAIQEVNNKKAQETQTQNYERDTFVPSSEKRPQIEEKEEAKDFKKAIDYEYTNAALKYAKTLDSDSLSTSKEGKLNDKWQEIKSDEEKLTSITTPNTTVLEGVKEFITSLSGLINDTKHFNMNKEKESDFSLETVRDIEDKNNNIEVYGTNIFTANPFKSTLETFDYEYEDVAV